MALYPQRVEVSDELIIALTKSYSKAYERIIREIITASDFGVANRRALLRQIEDELDRLGSDTYKVIQKELPKKYREGANSAVKQLKNQKAPVEVSAGFNRIHKQAISALVDETARAFGESLTGVGRQANLLLGKAVRESITQKLAEGTIKGSALRQVKNEIKGELQERGMQALIDRGGKPWTLDRYAEMLFRTKTVEARNRGLANRMAENNYDLVQVTDTRSNHYECQIWEGKILSVSGQTRGYPTVAQAEASGLFHPNCQHAINALIPSLARETKAYNPDEDTVVIKQEIPDNEV